MISIRLDYKRNIKTTHQKALSFAMHRVANTACAEIRREIKQYYTIRPSVLTSKYIRPFSIDINTKTIKIIVKSPRHKTGVPLSYFALYIRKENIITKRARLIKVGKRTKLGRQARQVIVPYVQIRKDRPLKRLSNNVFVAKMQSQHIGVFKRLTNKRLPIKEVYAISAEKMVGRQMVQEVRSAIMNDFQKHYTAYITKIRE